MKRLEPRAEHEARAPKVRRGEQHDEIAQAPHGHEVLDGVRGDHVKFVGIRREIVFPVKAERVEQLAARALGKQQKAHVVQDVQGVEIVEVDVLHGAKRGAHGGVANTAASRCGEETLYAAPMYLVALADLATSPDEEAPLLARDLGVSAYDARGLLSGERPKVILRTPDQQRARALLGALRERRHGAVAFDARAIVPAAAMVNVGDFRFEPESMCTDRGEALAYSDVLAILRGVRSHHQSSSKVVKERKFAVGAAIASGGLILTKKSEREVTTRSETREQIIFIIRKSGMTPWLIAEQRACFEGLGAEMAPSVTENLVRFLSALRSRAQAATYNDSLMRFRAGNDGVGHEERLAEQVHALALTISRLGAGPYR